MKIDRKLHLVIPVTLDDDSEVFVHSTPVSSEVYKNYWKVLARTFALINTEGFAEVGPKVANEVIQEVAMQYGRWEGEAGVKQGLIAEILRLTNVIMPSAQGWQAVPFDDAKSRSLVNSDEYDEIRGKLIFFTVSFHLHDKAVRLQMLRGVFAPWRSRIDFLDCTEFMNSLSILTKTEDTATKAIIS